MASTIQLSHLVTSDNSRTIPVANLAEMNGGFTLRNKLIDGRFDFWYEGTSKAINGSITAGYYTTSMANDVFANGVGSFEQITLLPGEIDIPTARFAKRVTITSVTSNSTSQVNQILYIEDVRTLAGKTVTVSFSARADTTRNIAIELVQNFGTGGSAEVFNIGSQKITLTPQFTRHTVTLDIPSLTNKTIGDGSHLRLIFWLSAGSSYSSRAAGLGEQTGVFDLACVQLEEGSVATPFEELPLSLSKCLVDRYVQYINLSSDWSLAYMNGLVATTSPITFPAMRTLPAGSALTPGNFSYRTVAGVHKATPTTATLIVGDHILRLRFDVTATYAAGDYIGCSVSQYQILSARF